MGNKIFKGKNLEVCLEKASEMLSIPKEDIDYSILKETKGVFKNKCEIEVKYKEESTIGIPDIENMEEKLEKLEKKIGDTIQSTNNPDENIDKDIFIKEDKLEIQSEVYDEFTLHFPNMINVIVDDSPAIDGQKVKKEIGRAHV